MKGTFFQKPFEFNLLVEGESWRQGDPIRGSLTVRNRGSEAASTEGIGVFLAYGGLKKVHRKDDGALEILASSTYSETSGSLPALSAQGEAVYSWKFETDRNSAVTDASASLFIVYGALGKENAAEKIGVLQLTVIPFQVLEDFLQILQIQCRFVKKTQKTSKGRVETKFDPPTSKGFALVEQLVVATRFEGDELRVGYCFNLKKMEATAASMTVKKDKREFEQSFTPADYKIASGRFNHERMEAAVREVLAQIESKALY